MTPRRTPALDRLLAALAPPGVAFSAGPIGNPPPSRYREEEAAVAGAVPGRRREFRAGRRRARAALALLAVPAGPLPRLPGRAPGWPDRCIGSISHSGSLCVAVAARRGRLLALGVDIEPVAPLHPSLARAILTPAEQARAPAGGGEGCPLALRSFSAKEAAFKACNSLDARRPGFRDVTIDWERAGGRFRARGGPGFPELHGAWGIAQGHVLTLAWIAAKHGAPGSEPTATPAGEDGMDTTELIDTILAAWRPILGETAIGPDDDFIEIGGSSMQMLAMINRLEERFGREINILELEEGVTPRGLARLFA